jgi:hypothetical protein
VCEDTGMGILPDTTHYVRRGASVRRKGPRGPLILCAEHVEPARANLYKPCELDHCGSTAADCERCEAARED